MASSPRLVHTAGARKGASDLLPPGGALLGRDPSQCHVVIAETDDEVSRVHAQVWFAEGRWWVVDRSGRAGTTVDGVAAKDPLPLREDAVIGLGASVRLVFRAQVDGQGQAKRLGGVAVVMGVVVALAVAGLPGMRARWEPVLAGLVGARRAEGPVIEASREHALAEPALADKVRSLLTDLSGDRYRCPIPDTFLEEIRDELVALHRTKRSQCTMLRWRDPVREVLRAEAAAIGQPASRAEALVYLAWVESNYEATDACSWVGARGMWQFMPGTARDYGLRVEGAVDQRCHWTDNTRAAMRYLGDLFTQCGSDHPLLAIAGYNTGGTRSCRLKGDDPCKGWDFRSFYVRGTLHDETTEYVPRFVASWLVGEAPELALTEARRRDPTLLPIPGCPDGDVFSPPVAHACATPASACADLRPARGSPAH